jgi:hypothetical protein
MYKSRTTINWCFVSNIYFQFCLINILFSRNQNTSPPPSSRPDHVAFTAIENTTPVKDSRSSSVSQPIPVPTQVHNFEKMQESRNRAKSLGDALINSPNGSPSDGKIIYIFKRLYIYQSWFN